MTAALFILGVILPAAAVMLSVRRYLPAGAARLVMLAMPLWLVYVGVLSLTGVVADAALRPPGVFFILLPVFMFIGLSAVCSAGGLRAAVGLPIVLLIGGQVFRVPVACGKPCDTCPGRAARSASAGLNAPASSMALARAASA